MIYFSEEVLRHTWSIVYWISFALTWIIIPITNSYFQTGEFTFWRKLKSSIYNNLLYQLVLLLLGLAFISLLIYSNSQFWNLSHLLSFLMGLSNGYGLILIIGFMGYGFIQFPRHFWKQSSLQKTLYRMERKAETLFESLMDAEADWKGVVRDVVVVRQRIQQNDIAESDPVRKSEMTVFVEHLIREHCPDAIEESTLRVMESSLRDSPLWSCPLTQRQLEKLHVRTKMTFTMLDKSRGKWNQLLKGAWWCQDVLACQRRRNRRDATCCSGFTTFCSRFDALELDKLRSLSGEQTDGEDYTDSHHRRATNSSKSLSTWFWTTRIRIKGFFLSIYYTYLRDHVYRFLSVFFWIMSVLIIYCEVTFPFDSDTEPTYDLLALLTHYLTHTLKNITLLQLLSLFTLSYMVLCTFWSIFTVKLFRFFTGTNGSGYSLVGPNATDESSLLFFAAYLTRLMFPLCHNFLNLVKETSTTFHIVMGKMDLIPILGTGFLHMYLPIAIGVFFTIALVGSVKGVQRAWRGCWCGRWLASVQDGDEDEENEDLERLMDGDETDHESNDGVRGSRTGGSVTGRNLIEKAWKAEQKRLERLEIVPVERTRSDSELSGVNWWTRVREFLASVTVFGRTNRIRVQSGESGEEEGVVVPVTLASTSVVNDERGKVSRDRERNASFPGNINPNINVQNVVDAAVWKWDE